MNGRRIAALVVLAGVAATAPVAVGGTVSVALDPSYREGVTGGGGWYRVPVSATYTCTPAALEVVIACPADEVFADGAGSEVDGRPVAVLRIARFGTFPLGEDVAVVTVEAAPGVPLRVDTAPPPAPVITRPVPGAVVRPLALLTADYACPFTGDRSGPAATGACVGTVPDGEPLPTGSADPATWGDRVLRVTARDAAGNLATASAAYRVEPEPTPSPPPDVVTAVPPPLAPPARSLTPRVRNAVSLRPAPGARLARRGVLRWRAAGGASRYNVQVFRIAPGRYVKVLSAFPRGTSLRLPPRRLVPGQRYAWRVWPYLGARGRYSRAPAGISWFIARR